MSIYERTKSALLLTLSLLFLPIIAMAATGETSADFSGILSVFVLPAFKAVLLAALSALSVKASKRYGVTIEQQVLEEAVDYAEQLGNALIMQSGQGLSPDQSQANAIAYVMSHGPKSLTSLPEADLMNRLDATVQRVYNRGRGYAREFARKQLQARLHSPEQTDISDTVKEPTKD